MPESRRRPHSLHESGDAQSFLQAFQHETGETLDRIVHRFASPEGIAAVVLGGSIPLGTGTSTSDVDVLVLVDGVDALKPAAAGGRGGSNEWQTGAPVGEGETLLVAESIAIVNGVELNLEGVLMPRLADVHRRLSQGGAWVSLTGHDTRIFSRLRTGWLLWSSGRFEDAYGALLKNRAFEIHATVRYLALACTDFEDARAALPHEVPVALHLGRLCVEKCFLAYFASRGYVVLGSKWLRAVRHQGDGPLGRAGRALGALVPAGVSLMFPAMAGADGARDYLACVADFLAAIRHVIELDTACAVAIRLCPQIVDPRAPLAPAVPSAQPRDPAAIHV